MQTFHQIVPIVRLMNLETYLLCFSVFSFRPEWNVIHLHLQFSPFIRIIAISFYLNQSKM